MWNFKGKVEQMNLNIKIIENQVEFHTLSNGSCFRSNGAIFHKINEHATSYYYGEPLQNAVNLSSGLGLSVAFAPDDIVEPIDCELHVKRIG
jgi:hypothetical protein